jgi:hypothetical protein
MQSFRRGEQFYTDADRTPPALGLQVLIELHTVLRVAQQT